MSATTKKPLVDGCELAEVLGIRPCTVDTMFKRRRIPGYRVGKSARFNLDEVLEHLRVQAKPEARQNQSTAETP